MIHHYLVPRVGLGITKVGGPFQPKYTQNPFAQSKDPVLFPLPWECQDFGDKDIMMVIVDVDDKQHAEIIAQPDVTEIKAGAKTDLEATLSAESITNNISAKATDQDVVDHMLELAKTKQIEFGQAQKNVNSI